MPNAEDDMSVQEQKNEQRAGNLTESARFPQVHMLFTTPPRDSEKNPRVADARTAHLDVEHESHTNPRNPSSSLLHSVDPSVDASPFSLARTLGNGGRVSAWGQEVHHHTVLSHLRIISASSTNKKFGLRVSSFRGLSRRQKDENFRFPLRA